MPTYPPQPVTFVRGEGTRLWDSDGNEYLDFLCGLAVTSPRSREPRGRRRHRRAGPDAAARVQPVRHRAGRGRRRHARPPDRRRRRTRVLLQLRRRGERVRHQAGSQVRRARPPRRRQRVRVVPRPHAGDAARDWSAAEARAVPAAARRASATSPGTTSTRSRPRSTRRSPRCCSSRCRAKAA